MAGQPEPNALEVTLPLFIKPGEPITPPILVSFPETRSDGNIPHMYQARLVVSSINGVPQDPRSPPPVDVILHGDTTAAFILRTASKLWFLFGGEGGLSFKPASDGHCFKFAVQLWACWYDKAIKSWEREMYQGEVETSEITCSQSQDWAANPETRAWDIAQVESIRDISSRQPAVTLGEIARKHRKITLHPDLLQGPWASPDRPSRRTG
ncbi:hypothetical protein HIM_06503 [Hirsutella minnesotensis 3608]|uniref:Uncharacterized protein n=1 Tax=Hirsutella minnesotensis 3608 TaxID=1043627 RepID=A0A0F8A4R8_9HYPO|nr:hypothetical protein HIM_06503 [Hirsutella minnesotensis 3608]